MRLEVRCCCDPGKLLGWLDVRQGDCLPGAKIKLALLNRARLEFGTPVREQLGPRAIVLTVAWITSNQRDAFLALKSDDTPIDVLRRCPAFMPNHEEITDGEQCQPRRAREG